MRIEIENVIQADESAGEKVEAAKVEAEGIKARARREAQEFISAKEEEYASLFRGEQEKIATEAATRAQSVLEETNGYIERISKTKEAVLNAVVERLLKRITGV